jgi:hypothetical protein
MSTKLRKKGSYRPIPAAAEELPSDVYVAAVEELRGVIERPQANEGSPTDDLPEIAPPKDSEFFPPRYIVEGRNPYPISRATDLEIVGASGIRSDLSAKNELMWWPYRSVSRALLQTQRNAAAYLEANQQLVEGMQAIVRQEQTLVSELSETAFNTNDIFLRAMRGIRELGEAWIDAQLRSLNIMRLHSDVRHSDDPQDGTRV